MDQETGIWRPAPQRPYEWSGQALSVSVATLKMTAAALRSVRAMEAACIWLGPINEAGNAIVEAVVMPKQLNRPRNYSVSGSAMLEVANIGRAKGWTVVGAIHSHPGSSVEHSIYDDEMTPSRRAVSIVFPTYGHWTGNWPRDLGIHAYVNDYWYLLSDADAVRRVELHDGPQAFWMDLR
jgi:hypothetical protein